MRPTAMKRVRHGNFQYRYIRPQRGRTAGRFGDDRGIFSRFGEGRPKSLAAIAILATLAAGAAWYLFWSPAFRVREVEIRGASADTEQIIRGLIDRRLAGRRLLILPENSMFVFDQAAAMKGIGRSLFLDELQMTQKLPGRLTVDIRERALRSVLLTDKRFWGLDGAGLILRELTAREIEALGDLPPDIGSASVPELGAESMDVRPDDAAKPGKESAAADVEPVKNNVNKYPVIIDGATGSKAPAKEKRPGDSAFTETVMALILQANARLPDLTGARVRWFSVRDSGETIDATMDGDWLIYLTALLPFDVQGSRLALVLKERIGSRKNELEYIDLRYNERIFFRFK